jgi:hypothetical protein
MSRFKFIEFVSSSMATTDAIAQVLASTLNPESNVRVAAELHLTELLKSPRKSHFSNVPARRRAAHALAPLALTYDFLGFKTQIESALSLAQLVLFQDAESSLRQMSSFALRGCTERSLDGASVFFFFFFWLSTRRSSFSGNT